MRRPKAPVILGAVAASAAIPAVASAAELAVSVQIPQLKVAEYHRPYVALWIERADASPVKTLAVWYDVKMRNNEGAQWLKDMRQWWRREGRAMTMPADGVSGPTRAPGVAQINFTPAQLGSLPPGEYALVVEAAREVGGREVVKVPFSWPAKGGAKTTSAKGAAELGAVTVTAKP